jgi:flagellar basal-body rod protein FlgB
LEATVLNLDNYFGVHVRALQLETRRTELLASNLANADTPNYKARDIDFRTALANAGQTTQGGTLAMRATDQSHLAARGTDASHDPELKYRVPMAPALDGNTVDAQLEQAAFAENSVRYQATLTFLNSKLRGLLTAITGQ